VEGDLPAAAWLQFFEELNRCAVTEVTLAGGEPFIRGDLKEIISGIVRNRMRFQILSNGTLIDDEIASFIASTGRCNYVQVSIDGSMPESHDVMRGRGSFAKALQGLMTLRRHGVPAAVRVTIHRKNVHDLEGIAKLLLEDLRLSSFGTNSVGAMGLCRKNAEMVQLTTEERVLAMETLLH
jgi:SynChlorMet cassette radical SAM/SPASM protein ScmE